MNSLFRCSWIKNTSIIKENAEIGEALLMESNISKTLKSVMKKCAEAGVGIPYRDSRLFFLKYLKDLHPDKIPQSFNELFPEGGKRPEGKHVNALVGSMVLDEKLPKDFVEKMSDEFEDYSKEKVKSWDGKEIDRVTAFLRGENAQRGGEKTPDEIEKDVKIGGLSKQEKFRKGNTGFETLNINLTPDTELSYVDDSPFGNPIYTASKQGLKYRVTLKSKKSYLPAKIPLSAVSKNDVASVVVVEPSKKQVVTLPTVGDLEAPQVIQDKPVADYPAEGSGDFSTPDPEELVKGGKAAREELYGYEDEPEANTNAGSVSDNELAFMGDDEPAEQKSPAEVPQAESEPAVDAPAVDEPKLTRDQKFEKKKGYWEKLKETNPELYARAWAKRQETLRGEENEEDLDELNMDDDIQTDELDMSGEEDSEGKNNPVNHTIIIIKKSPQSVHREMMQKITQNKESRMRHERRNTLGY